MKHSQNFEENKFKMMLLPKKTRAANRASMHARAFKLSNWSFSKRGGTKVVAVHPAALVT
jgi:hypothetical protein